MSSPPPKKKAKTSELSSVESSLQHKTSKNDKKSGKGEVSEILDSSDSDNSSVSSFSVSEDETPQPTNSKKRQRSDSTSASEDEDPNSYVFIANSFEFDFLKQIDYSFSNILLEDWSQSQLKMEHPI